MRMLLSFLFLTHVALGATYTLDDLNVLSEQNAYQEFFAHALDVRPTERGERWQGMVSKMAQVMTSSILKQSEITAKDFKAIEDLGSLPGMRTDDVYKLRRQEVGLRYFKSCVKSTAPCWETIRHFWEKDPTDPELGLKLAELVNQHPESQLPTWPFLEVALKSSLSEFYCKKPFVMKNLWDKFGIDYIRLGSEGDLLKKIDATVHPDCLPSVNEEARRRLFASGRPEDRELAYRILEAQGKVDQRTTDYFYTVYLLERPSQGELFNYSWNRLKELGAHQPRREMVLNLIRHQRSLPDEVFGSIDVAKRRAILIHFKNNFPEYLSWYSSQCIKFFKGSGSFPDGNPTLQCQTLMNSDLAKDVLPVTTVQEFQNARKI